MIIFPLILLGIFTTMASKSSNPVKTRVAILALRITIFFQMRATTGASWIPILITILFIGGIIIMFIILSAVLPNEKRMRVKSFFVLTLALTITTLEFGWGVTGRVRAEKYKRFLISGVNFWAMIILILTYFIARMSSLNSEETPIRTLYCY